MNNISGEILEHILTICKEKRDSNEGRYNCGYNNALGRIRFEIKQKKREEEDRLFILLNAHPERNIKLGGQEYVEECMKFMKKKFEIFEDELGNVQIVRIDDDHRMFVDREEARPAKMIDYLNNWFGERGGA